MQLNIDSFNKKQSTRDRIEETIASNIEIKGLEKLAFLSEHLKEIFEYYELENGILRLKDETCSSCKKKLKRKGVYQKEISLPGGLTMLLNFHQYSCPHCKKKVDRKLGSWFEEGERYSSNIKSDAVRLYLSHLSSYDAVRMELNKLYQRNFSKLTIRRWLDKIGFRAGKSIEKETDFSGHFVYDEEYLKVFEGDVGKKGSTLKRIEVYLLLFRDAITKKAIVMLSDSLDKTKLIEHWKDFVQWTIKNNIPLKTFTTDGKREYYTMIQEINKEFKLKIEHSYCVFHFKKNLFEVSNKYFFGVMQTKKELPEHVKNQIKEISKYVDLPTKKEYDDNLWKLVHQKNTFIPPLQDQIIRLNKYKESYGLHKTYPFLRTTNICEQWFGQTKPSKFKKGFKTRKGVLNIAKALAVKITNYNWKNILEVPKDIEDTTSLMISLLIYKRNIIRPA